MDDDRATLRKALSQALSGEAAHVEIMRAFEGLDWQLAGARPPGVEHSVFQLLNHMAYWQAWVLQWLDGEDPPIPEHASGSWSGNAAPSSPEEWERAVRGLGSALEELRARSREGDLLALRQVASADKSRLEMLQTIALHNSYHVGQVVLVRQMLGAWPPPSGGLTW